jgi:hypothetical protein
MSADENYVVLRLKAREQTRYRSPFGAYRSDNIRSIKQYVFLRKYEEFLNKVFGSDGKDKGEKK